MIAVLCLFAALMGNGLASHFHTHGLLSPGYSVHGAPFAANPGGVPWTPTIHNVPTPFGLYFTGISYRHSWEAQPPRVHNAWGLSPYGLNYGYGLQTFGYPNLWK
ncbi:uncharacterized protein LOC142574074 [Dermacentor variabilis]|uniref:uncharacterized protein LOC142574074 n=1 Tax=Dermacentor variabilis TaxID=34621 RepID=UPI003F5CBA21